ncbi:exosome complex exonuclease rrp43 [Ophiostoma piceae UAMH 11346]|uniref:Ribosomal RNA-processing protein 43 n=1 Tax=Ophiostoma piceae (strain UAMH 11346) TaxID=1262450 RepID=S3C0R6_OPHP1|nr:exosome complex exonuclease rrp43 [Ophiostoma piceae UAMH 11346]
MSQQKSQMSLPIFSKIAPHEFLIANLRVPGEGDSSSDDEGTRPNGRAPSKGREFEVNAGSLSQAHGSTALRLGRTSVICGVRGEILPVDSIPQFRPSTVASETDDAASVEADNRRQLRDYDLLVPNLELSTGSAPEFLPGGPPSVLAQVLSTRLYALLHSSGLVDAECLKIWHQKETKKSTESMDVDDDEEEEEEEEPQVKAYWTLYIDIVFLSFDGNPFDAAWAAILAALRDTRLPHARWDADRDRVVCSPAAVEPSVPLTLRGLPVATTAVVCVQNKKKQQRQSSEAAGAHWILTDPDRLEETDCRESITVVVDRQEVDSKKKGKKTSKTVERKTVVRALSKTGGVLVGPDDMHALVATAEQRWASMAKALGQGP